VISANNITTQLSAQPPLTVTRTGGGPKKITPDCHVPIPKHDMDNEQMFLIILRHGIVPLIKTYDLMMA
jgi:hypothetical protein